MYKEFLNEEFYYDVLYKCDVKKILYKEFLKEDKFVYGLDGFDIIKEIDSDVLRIEEFLVIGECFKGFYGGEFCRDEFYKDEFEGGDVKNFEGLEFDVFIKCEDFIYEYLKYEDKSDDFKFMIYR